MSSSLSASAGGAYVVHSADDGRLVCAFAGDIQEYASVEAMRLSFFACVKNIVAFQIYALFLVVLTIIATMPYGLGLFVLVPTLFASIYASYQDIFCDPPKPHEIWLFMNWLSARFQSGASLAYSSNSHFVPARPNLTSTRASAP